MSSTAREKDLGPSRFVVGIDLGTTNSALAFVDTATLDDRGAGATIQTLDVPQVTAPGTLEPRPLLPSFLYLASAEELGSGGFALPWGAPPEGRVAGTLAARRAAEAPDRVVSSAKSWLCNERIDRTAPILPWVPDGGIATEEASTEVARVSPLAASTAYLAHLRDAWNAAMAADDPSLRLEQQDIFLTVPASFDAVARELTVRAASEAGFARVHLLEEPQAALYAWVHGAGEGWREDLRIGDVLLVCDVGGGTTDFSVVLVDEEDGRLALRRVAVGDHLLLGGDNMDLALAFAVRERLARDGKRIDAWQFRGLVLACREAKERLLGADPPDSVPLSILGRGKKLIGGTLRAELKREEVDALLLDGFLPVVDASARAATVAESGLSELGLPFAADAAITRHLATFLSSHRAVAEGDDAAPAADDGLIHPTALLFNGGVMQARAMQRRVADVLGAWARAAKVAEPRILPGSDLTHAVARGAAYFGLARRGRGVRIRGGTARSYYVGVASAMPAVPGQPPPVKALCVVPFGIEEGTELAVPGAEFGLLVGQQARFRFFASSTRGDDPVGLVLDEWDTAELEELAPLSARLDGSASGRVPVRLSAHVTEIGTLELWFVAREGGERWKLEFTVRGTGSAS